MKKIINILLPLIIISLLSLFIWKASENDDSYYITTKPFMADISNKRIMSGNVYPSKEVEMKSPISGVLDELFVEIGDNVNIGDAIAKIKLVPNPSDIERLESNLITSKIEFENNKKIYDRNKILLEDSVIAGADFVQIERNFDLAMHQYKSAQDQLNLIKEGTISNLNFSNVVKASIKGVVIDLPIKQGYSVIERNNFNEGTTIALLAQLDVFIFRGYINETDLSYLKQGMHLNIKFNAFKNTNTDAVLSKISAKGIEEQGIMKYMIEAKFEMNKTMPFLRSGNSATAEFVLEEKKNILVIDEKVLLFENDSIAVEIILPNKKVEKRTIKTGISDGTNIEVINGILINDILKMH